jgi:hypothetical protein
LKLREARRYGRAFFRGLRQTMTTLIDGKGFTDDAGKTLFS